MRDLGEMDGYIEVEVFEHGLEVVGIRGARGPTLRVGEGGGSD